MEGAVDEADEILDDQSEIPKLTLDLWRIIQHTSLQVQSSGRDVIIGADILIELFTEPAGHFLK
jgi:hypothetical protein